MANQKSYEALDTTILVLHPSSAPHVVNTDGALEFEEDGALVLPAQKQLKDAMVRVLTDFASFRKTAAIAVESWLRVEPQSDVEFPATYVVRLVGAGVTSAEVAVFRAAARCVLGGLVPQRALGDQEAEQLLGESEVEVLTSLGEGVAARFANKSIKQGVMVRFGSTDLQGVTLQGVMPALAVEQGALATIKGVARPIGFDEHKSTATLWINKAANDDKDSHSEGRLEVLCHNLDLLRTLARAYVNRNPVEFKAISQPEAKRKKTAITLLALTEIAANHIDEFELQ